MQSIIRPSADLRNKYSELSRLTREQRAPIAITVNGREDTVLINHALYVQMIEELELMKSIAEAEQDFENGRFDNAENVLSNLREELKKSYEL